MHLLYPRYNLQDSIVKVKELEEREVNSVELVQCLEKHYSFLRYTSSRKRLVKV